MAIDNIFQVLEKKSIMVKLHEATISNQYSLNSAILCTLSVNSIPAIPMIPKLRLKGLNSSFQLKIY